MRRSLLLLVGILTLPVSAWAQIGRAPQDSPYRTIRYPMNLSVTTGIIRGGRGRVRVGPSNATTIGARGEIRLSGFVSAAFSFSYADGDRFIQNPQQPVDTRESGPVSQTVILTDAGFTFSLTGGKTWHGIAPFAGVAFGAAFGSDIPEDDSGFDFGFKLTFQPSIGVRIYPSQRVYLRIEVRDLLWRLKYPLSFQNPPPDNPTLPTVLPPGSGDSQWVHHLNLSIGIGWAFRL